MNSAAVARPIEPSEQPVNNDPHAINPYDLMRYLKAGEGSRVYGHSLVLKQIWATGAGVSLEFVGVRERVALDIRTEVAN